MDHIASEQNISIEQDEVNILPLIHDMLIRASWR